MRLVSAALISSVLAACSGARPAPSSILDERFDTAEAEAARETAPDLYAAASRARIAAAHAEEAGRRDVAEDHSTRARLLLDAAIAEAERLALEEERLAVEAREAETELAHGRAVTRREEILLEVRRIEASRVAAAESAAAFERATEDEARRYRGRSDERAALHQAAAAVLARRAHLLLAAAQAQGAGTERITTVNELLERADEERNAAEKLQLTERAVRDALRALGEARQSRPAPTTDERAALIEEAEQVGFSVEQRDRGLTVIVPNVFRGNVAAPTGGGRRRMSRLAALIQAHPHGPVQIQAYGSGGTRARQRTSARRANWATRILSNEGVPQERLAADGIVDDVGQASIVDSIEATFVSYGPGEG
jgi:hypothetical protein